METIMIDQTLEVIRKEVNNYILTQSGNTTNGDKVILTSLVDDTGKIIIPVDSIGISLINIEEEKYFKTTGLMQTQRSDTTTGFIRPPIHLNLQIMFAAHFTQYAESLKHISYILSFFQKKPVFDVDNTQALTTINVKKLILELNTINLEHLNYIWGMIGTRYLPSNIYKVRMLSVQESDIAMEVPNIQTITTSVDKKEVND
jgi:hypothetical protein